MKCRYEGSIPMLMVLENKLTTVSCGDVVDVPTLPSSEFVSLEAPLPKTPVVEKKKPAVKKTQTKEVTNATKTETSKLG